MVFVFYFLKKVLFWKMQMGNFQRREENTCHMQQRWLCYMDWSLSKGCILPPCAWPEGRSESVPAGKYINHPKWCESSFKGLRTFPKQTLPPFWFCYKSRWNQVVLTEFLFEVWCGSQKSKNPKTSGVKRKASTSCEKGFLTPSETKPERAREPRGGTATPASSSSSRVAQTSDSAWQKLHPPN